MAETYSSHQQRYHIVTTGLPYFQKRVGKLLEIHYWPKQIQTFYRRGKHLAIRHHMKTRSLYRTAMIAVQMVIINTTSTKNTYGRAPLSHIHELTATLKDTTVFPRSI